MKTNENTINLIEPYVATLSGLQLPSLAFIKMAASYFQVELSLKPVEDPRKLLKDRGHIAKFKWFYVLQKF